MASTFALAPIPIWYFADQNGQPAGGCIMYPRSSKNNSLWKPVFTDADGITPWPFDANGGIVFEANASQGPFYWEDNGFDLYNLTIYNQQGDLLWSIEDYPVDAGGGSTPITEIHNTNNLIIDGQFRFLGFGPVLSPIPDGELQLEPYFYGPTIVGGWFFLKNLVGNVDTLSFSRVPLGDTSPDSNPLNILTYQCSVGGAGDQLDLVYRFHDVKSFSGQEISIQFAAEAVAAPGGVMGEVFYRQNFGTGGAPSPTNFVPVAFTWPAGVFGDITNTFSVTSVAGSSLGTNNDDYFEVGIRYPIGSLGTYNLTNFQMILGNKFPADYLYETYVDTAYKVTIYQLQNTVNNLLNAVAQTGEWIWTLNNTGRTGWLVVNNSQTLGNTGSLATFSGQLYFNLYVFWWNMMASHQPLVVGGQGVSALADWNALKPMHMPNWDSLAMANAAGGFAPYGGYVDPAGQRTHTLTLSEMPQHAHNLSRNTGEPVLGIPIDSYSLVHASVSSTDMTLTAGGSAPHNNVQPTFYGYMLVKL